MTIDVIICFQGAKWGKYMYFTYLRASLVPIWGIKFLAAMLMWLHLARALVCVCVFRSLFFRMFVSVNWTYVQIFVRMYVYTFLAVCLFEQLLLYASTQASESLHIRVCLDLCGCMSVCLCVYLPLWPSVNSCICKFFNLCLHVCQSLFICPCCFAFVEMAPCTYSMSVYACPYVYISVYAFPYVCGASL